MADLGTGLSTFTNGDGMGGVFVFVTGRRLLAERVLRLWLQRKGSLITNPEVGEDITDLLSSEFDDSPEGLTTVAMSLDHEARTDEGVEDINVIITADRTTEKVTIRGTITPADGSGEFEFVFLLATDKISILVPGSA